MRSGVMRIVAMSRHTVVLVSIGISPSFHIQSSLPPARRRNDVVRIQVGVVCCGNKGERFKLRQAPDQFPAAYVVTLLA